MSDINALIAQGSKFGNAFGNFADSYEEQSRYAQKQAEDDRVRNAFTMAGEAAKAGDYKGASNWLLQARQPGPAIDLMTSSDPTLQANREQFFQPQPFTGPDQQTHWLQGSNKGGAMREAGLPTGYTTPNHLKTYDTGTGTGFYDPRGLPTAGPPPMGGAPPAAAPAMAGSAPPASAPTPAISPGAVLPKDLEGKARAEETGQIQAKARAALPAVEQNVQTALDTIQRLRTNKEGRKLARGMLYGRAPAIGGAQADWVSDYDQLRGKTFVDAFDALRGAGAISEREGEAGTKAKSSLNRIGEETKFDDDLTRLETMFTTGLANARQKAAATQPNDRGGPPVGTVEDGFRFLGGDPTNPQSWEKVQ